NSRWVGFDKPETTGKALLKSLDYCLQQITKEGSLSSETTTILRHWANANLIAVSAGSSPLLISLAPFIDAFSSCSLFVVMGLFAYLWLYKDKKVLLGLGILFIIMISIVHHYQQNHAIFFYAVLNLMRLPAALVGLGMIVYLFMMYSKGRII